MKSTQLLSVVLSLIMVFGVTAGSAYAQTDDDHDTSIDEEIEAEIEEIEAEMEEIKAEIEDEVKDLEDEIEEIKAEMESEVEDATDNETDNETHEYYDDARDGDHPNIEDRLANFCDSSDEDKRQFFEDHPRLAQFSDRLANYCDLSDYARDSKLQDFIRNNVTDEDREKIREHVKDYDRDEDHDVDIDGVFRKKLAKWCEMSDEEKSTIAAKYGKTEDQIAKSNSYCTLDESDRAEFITEHRDEFKAHMKDKMMDKSHMDYDRICTLSESERAAEFVDSEKLERISKWCEMTPEEREDYKKEHHDSMKDKMMDKDHDGMKMFDMSPRLKEMIISKHDISDEKREEIKMKYIEKHGELTDERKSQLKMKFKEHMASKQVNMSDERKSEIHDRIAEMKAFKAELRERASEMSDEEKQELREEFIEKAKDMQLAWISPRHQMNVGINADEIECREGFSLVMKASNGVPMCLKADTALKMIDKGIAVPAN